MYFWDNYFSQRARAIDVVKANLVDPYTAIFSEVIFSKKTGHTCGYVNSKNRMGGYVGNELFVVESDGSVHFEPPEADESESIEEKIASTEGRIKFLELVRDCSSDD